MSHDETQETHTYGQPMRSIRGETEQSGLIQVKNEEERCKYRQVSMTQHSSKGREGRSNLPRTPFAVHYEKIRNHLRETATNSANKHSLAHKYERLRINQIQ